MLLYQGSIGWRVIAAEDVCHRDTGIEPAAPVTLQGIYNIDQCASPTAAWCGGLALGHLERHKAGQLVQVVLPEKPLDWVELVVMVVAGVLKQTL